MASLFSTSSSPSPSNSTSMSTILERSLKHLPSPPQYSFRFRPCTNQKKDSKATSPAPASLFPSPGSVRKLAANFEVREPSAANAKKINAIVPEDTTSHIVEKEKANEMVELIALRLQPSQHKRSSSSLGHLEKFTPATSSPRTVLQSTDERRKGLVPALNLLPNTREEWKVAMEGVKALFGKRHYKQCAQRSKALLDNIKNTSQMHPLYTIYLYFYTAMSLEQTARSLHNLSSTKLPLFHESLLYYQKAATSLSTASFTPTTTAKLIRLTERTSFTNLNRISKSSISSSNRSSIDSIFSQASSTTSEASDGSSRPPSPQSKSHHRNISSIDLKPMPLKVQKRVSFAQDLPKLTSTSQTTLQSEVEEKANTEVNLLDCFPLPPPSPPFLQTNRLSTSSTISISPTSPSDSYYTHDLPSLQEQQANTHTPTRYQTTLSSLSTQITYHINALESQMQSFVESLSSRHSKTHAEISFSSTTGINGVDGEEVKRVGLQARIARLRGTGWERKRFEAGRYRDLCERAVGEVEGCHF